MNIDLHTLERCFEGAVPSLMCTASADGVPNLAHLSHVHLVDEQHVATSNQFFTKTTANLVANPMACLLVIDPENMDNHSLLVRHERSETSGPLFDRVRESIEVIASLTGMSEVFELRAVDIFRVLDAHLMPSGRQDPPA